MEFSYGRGTYCEGESKHTGTIILSEHKLYLKKAEGDVVATYIPVEKISKIKRTFRGVEIHVQLTVTQRRRVSLYGERQLMSDLTADLVKRLGLKKRFLLREWIGDVSWR